MASMQIRACRETDWPEWLRMSTAFFPEATGMTESRRRTDLEVYVAERADGMLAGFVEVGTRPYADGCDTSHVGYLEAWFVDADVRRQGVGRALVVAAEARACARGYHEMASDARLDNTVSHAAPLCHREVGNGEHGSMGRRGLRRGLKISKI